MSNLLDARREPKSRSQYTQTGPIDEKDKQVEDTQKQ